MILKIIELPLRDHYTQHLFKAQSLSTELNPIDIRVLVTPPFELYRNNLYNMTIRSQPELDQITLTYQTQRQRTHRHPELLPKEPS